jgi:hypothetical protein
MFVLGQETDLILNVKTITNAKTKKIIAVTFKLL